MVADIILEATKVFGVVIAAGGAATVVWRFVKASRSAFASEIASEVKVLLRPLHATVAEIREELSFNGGSSVKDMTRANGEAIAELRVSVEDAAELARGVAADLAAAHERADTVPSSAPAGVAADAAVQTG
jgi:hypothetical protein